MAIVISPHADVTILSVGWPVYEALLAEAGDGGSSRIAYDGALLEIMSPSQKHEIYNRLLEAFVREISSEWRIDVLCSGSTTLRQKPHGAEADSSFYVGDHAARMRGEDNVDLGVDPAPDIVVEIDISRERIDKMAVYRALGVAEFWRYDGGQLRAYDLAQADHSEIERSPRLADVQIAELDRFLEMRATMSHFILLDLWRQWLRDHRPT